MTETLAPDAAVQIAIDGLCHADRLIELRDYARVIVAALTPRRVGRPHGRRPNHRRVT